MPPLLSVSRHRFPAPQRGSLKPIGIPGRSWLAQLLPKSFWTILFVLHSFGMLLHREHSKCRQPLAPAANFGLGPNIYLVGEWIRCENPINTMWAITTYLVPWTRFSAKSTEVMELISGEELNSLRERNRLIFPQLIFLGAS
jgi:hypothetical protein